MSDPLGLIGNVRVAPAMPHGVRAPAAGAGVAGPDFKQFLQDQIDQVNQLQSDATDATEDLAAGRRDDVEGVIIATQKADIAFKMLLQVRNKVMEAYDEI